MRCVDGRGRPPDGIEVFSSIFAQDTIANSAYNSLQASLDKRFSHGLQFTAAYTFSKSFDEASSFEGILNPIDPRRSRSLSGFDARHRIVFSYYWELPFHKYSGAMGKVLNGWALSGITTFQTGFPIRITSLAATTELMYSFISNCRASLLRSLPFILKNRKRTATTFSIKIVSRRMPATTPSCRAVRSLCSDALTNRCLGVWATLPVRSVAGRVSATLILPC